MPKVKLLLEYEWEDISEQLEEENQTLEEYVKYKLTEHGREAEAETFFQSDIVVPDLNIIGFEIESEGKIQKFLYENNNSGR